LLIRRWASLQGAWGYHFKSFKAALADAVSLKWANGNPLKQSFSG